MDETWLNKYIDFNQLYHDLSMMHYKELSDELKKFYTEENQLLDIDVNECTIYFDLVTFVWHDEENDGYVELTYNGTNFEELIIGTYD